MNDDEYSGAGGRKLRHSSEHDHEAREDESQVEASWPGRRTLVGRIYRDALSAPRRAGRPGAFTLVQFARKRPGGALPTSLRDRVGAKLGADLGAVRIHTDATAEVAAEALDARAFTLGQDIYFGAGHYNPESTAGQSLLVHEIVHTLQVGRVDGSPEVSQPGDAHEREAREIAGAWTSDAGPGSVRGSPGAATIHRSPLGSPVVAAPEPTGAAGVEAVAAPSLDLPAEDHVETAASDGASSGAVPESTGEVEPDATSPSTVRASASESSPVTSEPAMEADERADDAAASAPSSLPVVAMLARERLLTLAHGEALAGAAVGAGPASGGMATARVALQSEAERQRALVLGEIEAGRRGLDVVVVAQRRELLQAAQVDALRVRRHAHVEAERVPAAAALQRPAIQALAIATAETVPIAEHLRPQLLTMMHASAQEVAAELARRSETLRSRIRKGAASVADAIHGSAQTLVARLDARRAALARAWDEARALALDRIGQREQQGLRALQSLERSRAAASPVAGAERGAPGPARSRMLARAIATEMLRAEAELARGVGAGGTSDAGAPTPAVAAAVTAYGQRARRVIDAASSQPPASPWLPAHEVVAWMAGQGELARAALREAASESTQAALGSLRGEVAAVRARWTTGADRAIAATSNGVTGAVARLASTGAKLSGRFRQTASRAAAELERTDSDRMWAAIRHSLQTNLLYFAVATLAVALIVAGLSFSGITGLAALALAVKWVGLSIVSGTFIDALRKRLGSLSRMPGFGDMPWYEKAARGVAAVGAAAGDATLVGPAAEAMTGRDAVTGRQLTPEERAGLGTDVFLGVVGALLGRAMFPRKKAPRSTSGEPRTASPRVVEPEPAGRGRKGSRAGEANPESAREAAASEPRNPSRTPPATPAEPPASASPPYDPLILTDEQLVADGDSAPRSGESPDAASDRATAARQEYARRRAEARETNLSPEAQRAIAKIENEKGTRIGDVNADPNKNHYGAARRESAGEVVATRADGKPFDHIRDLQEGFMALENAEQALRAEQARAGRLSPRGLTVLMSRLAEVVRLKNRLKDFLRSIGQGGFPPFHEWIWDPKQQRWISTPPGS